MATTQAHFKTFLPSVSADFSFPNKSHGQVQNQWSGGVYLIQQGWLSPGCSPGGDQRWRGSVNASGTGWSQTREKWARWKTRREGRTQWAGENVTLLQVIVCRWHLSQAAKKQTFIKKASWFWNHATDRQNESRRHICTGSALPCCLSLRSPLVLLWLRLSGWVPGNRQMMTTGEMVALPHPGLS